MQIPNLTVLTLNTPNIKDFSAERNKLLSQAKTDWVLFVDSDETVSPDLEKEIKSQIESPKSWYYSAYQIKRLDNFLGLPLKHGETGNAMFVRLAKKEWGSWQGVVHEKWVGKGLVGTLKSPLFHTPHQTLSSFVDKINKYSSLAAQERYDRGVRSGFTQIIFYPIAKFVSNYVFKLGFLDGVPGLIHSLMMSWHSFQTHTKNYLLWHQK
ncbi:MAG: hypothetical protein Fur0011_5220 [Candidatus Microgenomates bacterium]